MESHPRSDAFDGRPMFFYHVPKSGGISVFSALAEPLRIMLMLRNRNADGSLSKAAERWIASLIHRYDDPSQEVLPIPHMLAATHLPFGLHHKLIGDYITFTVLRHPFDRTVSAYTYENMRSQNPVSLDGLKKFVNNPLNTNPMVRQFSGVDDKTPLGETHLIRAIENLCTLDHVVRIENTRTICEHLLSTHHLPNVVSDRLNPTLESYRLDGSALRDEIEQANRLDMRFFVAAPVTQTEPTEPAPETQLHPLVVDIREVGDAKKSRIQVSLHSLEQYLAQPPS
ncbi:sulfotransferase family 2 domain-containing protein [Rhodospira trueperi]|nr:sulfotransferase family 2 domain-containing protein [Rhodospira trueperi]